MKYLVTGSAGHLGEALVTMLLRQGHEVVSVDIKPSSTTSVVGSIADRGFVESVMAGVDAVIHPATLHKPHVVTHTKQDFIDTNISGTLNLLEAAVAQKVKSFVFTSTTSTYGEALRPPRSEPAIWVTEDTVPVPKNIYGVTKIAAEGLCHLIHKQHGLPCVILRTSRFFPEDDDNAELRARFPDGNLKALEFLYRRAEIEDVVSAHLRAVEKAPELGFGKYIITATTPFQQEDRMALREDPLSVVEKYHPGTAEVLKELGWNMLDDIERIYVNDLARCELGWQPKHDFRTTLEKLAAGEDPRSELAQSIGKKGYHEEVFEDGPYPV